jgi:hypothetical protein
MSLGAPVARRRPTALRLRSDALRHHPAAPAAPGPSPRHRVAVHVKKSLRARLHAQLEPTAWPGEGLSPLNRVIAAVIVLSVLTATWRPSPPSPRRTGG